MDVAKLGQVSSVVHSRYPLLEIARVHHTNKRSQPMSFQDKPYLVPLYAMLPNVREAVFCKAVQTAVSELLIELSLYQAGWNDRIVAYVLPQYRTSERFVSERINPVLLRTPAYASRLPGGGLGLDDDASNKGSLKRKRFGPRGSLLFLGSNTASDFVEFSCDLAIVDEYDNCDRANLASLPDRQMESAHPQKIIVGNPRVSGGIVSLWKAGSRARWNHRCAACGHHQWLDWLTHFVTRRSDGTWAPRDTQRADAPGLGDLRPVCERCRKPFDRGNDGVWVSAEPGAEVLSIHISRLDVLPSKADPQPIRAIYRLWVKAQGDSIKLAAFYTGILGWLYEPPGSRVTDEILDAACEGGLPLDHQGGEQYDDQTVVMGVDVGSKLNIVIDVLTVDTETPSSYRRRAVWVGTLVDFDDVIELSRRYHVDAMVIDALPETREAKRVRDVLNYEGECQVWLCQYHPTPRVGNDSFGLVFKYEERVVQVDRTQVLDCTLDELAGGWRTLPSDAGTVPDFRAQMKAPARRLNPVSNRVTWEEGSDPDHYRHADVYARIAQEIYDRSGGYFD